MNWSDSDFCLARGDSDAISHWRWLEGSAFSHDRKNQASRDPNFDDDCGTVDGVWFSLEELALQRGDKIELTYNFGDRNSFYIKITDAKSNQPVLPQKNIYGNETRAALIKQSGAKISKQYNWYI